MLILIFQSCAQPALDCTVERDMPGHDHVRIPGHEEQAGRPVTAGLEIVELPDQDARVNDATGSDRAALAGDDPARDLTDLVRLPGNDDRVAGVRTALVAADEVGLLREQVDDLPLALVAPLRADDDGRGHALECCTTVASQNSFQRS